MPATTAQKKKLIEYEFGSGNPATHYIGISLTNPTALGTGVLEPSISHGYTRIAVTNNKTTWSDFTNGTVSNKTTFEFPEVIDTNWNTLEQPLFLFIATTPMGIGDDIRYYIELTGADKKLLQVGAIVRFPVGVFQIQA